MNATTTKNTTTASVIAAANERAAAVAPVGGEITDADVIAGWDKLSDEERAGFTALGLGPDAATNPAAKVAKATTVKARAAKATTPRTRTAKATTAPAAPAPAEAPAAEAPAALIQYRSRRDPEVWLHYGNRSKVESAIHFLSTASARPDREWRAVDAATGAVLGERGLIAAEPATAA